MQGVNLCVEEVDQFVPASIEDSFVSYGGNGANDVNS